MDNFDIKMGTWDIWSLESSLLRSHGRLGGEIHGTPWYTRIIHGNWKFPHGGCFSGKSMNING